MFVNISKPQSVQSYWTCWLLPQSIGRVVSRKFQIQTLPLEKPWEPHMLSFCQCFWTPKWCHSQLWRGRILELCSEIVQERKQGSLCWLSSDSILYQSPQLYHSDCLWRPARGIPPTWWSGLFLAIFICVPAGLRFQVFPVPGRGWLCPAF